MKTKMTPKDYDIFSRNCKFFREDLFLNCNHSEGTFCMYEICPVVMGKEHQEKEETVSWIENLDQKEIRCATCQKLLGRIKADDGEIEIKCPKCKKVNTYDVEALEAQSI